MNLDKINNEGNLENTRELKLIYGLDPDKVYITENPEDPNTVPIFNSLTLIIANPDDSTSFVIKSNNGQAIKDKLSVIEENETEDDLSYFLIEFPLGKGTLDLTGIDDADEITCSPGPDNDSWEVEKYIDKKKGKCQFSLHTETEIKLGPKESVSFIFSKIKSTAKPGLTYMSIKNRNIVGFDDAEVRKEIRKYQRVKIDSLDVSPNPSTLVDGKAEVLVTWKAKNTKSLTLRIPETLEKDVTDLSSYTASLRKSTCITLVAAGGGSDNKDQKTIEVKVLQRINSFEAHPNLIYYKDFPHKVEFSWDVNTNEYIKLESSTGGKDANLYNHVGNVTRQIENPQMMTLTLENYENDLLLRRNLIVSAFKIVLESKDISAASSFVASSPNAGFIVATQTDQNKLCILDTLDYNEIGDPINTGKNPLGVTFSNDGSLIFVANSGDGTVSVIQVTTTVTPLSFKLIDTVNIGGSPQQVATSPDGKYLYVTVDYSAIPSKKDSLVILQKQDGTKFTQLNAFETGLSPRGLAVSPSGAQIFVANSRDNSISCISLSSQGKHSLGETIKDVYSQPTGLVVTPDGKTLLVVCSGSGNVYDIDIEYPDILSRPKLDVGKSPQQITLVPGSTYAFVTNQDDESVSLLNYKAAGDKRILDKIILKGSKPNGIAVSSEGGLLIVANKGQKSLTVLTLAQYQESTHPVEVGNLPTNIVASSDGSKILVWHNSLLKVQDPKDPFKGFYVYEKKSVKAFQIMEHLDIIGCVFSPNPKVNTAFVTQYNQSSITVLNTWTYRTVNSISIPDNRNGKNRYPQNLAISADGTTLFALVYDGDRKYSLVAFALDDKNKILTDVALFTTSATSFVYLAASQDGSKVFVINSVDKQLWIAKRNETEDPKTWDKSPSPITLGAAPKAMTVLPDGSKVFVFNKSSRATSISVVETDSLKVSTFSTSDIASVSISDMAISPDGTKIFATDGICAGIRVIDTSSLRFIQTISWESEDVESPYGIAVTPDGSQIFTANVYSSNIGVITQVNHIMMMLKNPSIFI